MTGKNALEILVYLAIIVALTPILGSYMKRVFAGERTWLDPVLRPVERGIYKVCGVDASRDQTWVDWTVTMLIVNAASLVVLYAMQRLQQFLPLNPNGFGAVSPDSSWNTAVSFTTNTNWQGYSGESTMSHFTQMAGLALHNFLSAATGIAIAIAIIRGIAREKAKGIGNFWYDCTRAILWVLLPFSFLAALFFVSRGVVQNFRPDVTVKTVEGVAAEDRAGPRRLPGGHQGARDQRRRLLQRQLRASLRKPDARNELSPAGADLRDRRGVDQHARSNDGLRPARMGGLRGHGDSCSWSGSSSATSPSSAATPSTRRPAWPRCRRPEGPAATWRARRSASGSATLPSSPRSRPTPPAAPSIPGTTRTRRSAAWCRSANIASGEIIVGGVGAGLYGMFLFIVLSVFIAGLMVGRTPEYLGKKIEAHEVKLAMLSVLVLTLCILGFSAAASVLPAGLSSLANKGPHGFSEILYAFESGAGNNGSAFAGLSANTLFYNTTLGFDMFFGRFFMLIPILGIAGSLAAKKKVPESVGTFPVTGPLFSFLLVGVILIVGALTFFPAFSLGPIVEQLLMKAGTLF